MRRIRAVVVDDDHDLRELLRIQLEQAGDIEIVGEGEGADTVIDLTESLHPDVIILDESMPGRSGIEVIPDVVAASPETLVIVYTANDGTTTRDAVLAAGGHAVVGKADPGALLVGTIHRLVEPSPEAERQSDDFGERMSELLHRDVDERSPRSTLREHGIRPWFVLLTVAALPLLMAAVWLAALALGWVGR